ncbi:MAG: hypothetical protein IJ518_02430 [Clostridia bacterium]|nr:hypothetical protein [Clostridia bacterium]
MVCTFFGHRDAPKDVEKPLRDVLVELITQRHVTHFLVGEQGAFDRMVIGQLRALQDIYPQISSTVVLAYHPCEQKTAHPNTLYPEGLERVPRRFAIAARNRWMVEQADIVVTYVRSPAGGAAQFQRLAKGKGKLVLAL